MRLALLLLAVAGCGFEAGGGAPTAGPDSGTDAMRDTLPVDAMPDVAIDTRLPHTCAGYSTVIGTGTESTYKRYEELSWPEAKTRCEQDTAYLAIPETQAEAIALYVFASPYTNVQYYWAGYTRSGNGVVDVLGHTNATPPWGSMQPNSGPNDPILIDNAGMYFDYMPTAQQEFACECAPN